MHEMMNGGMGGMMWGMGAIGVLAVAVLILVGAAMVKYIFFR